MSEQLACDPSLLPCLCKCRSPRRHRSSSQSPLRQKDRRDEERKEVKEKPAKVHQISGETACAHELFNRHSGNKHDDDDDDDCVCGSGGHAG